MVRSEIEQHLRTFFGSIEDVVAVYLFGSVARDAAGPGSDIDVGVLYRRTPDSTLSAGPLDLEGALERQFGQSVQVVILNTAPVDLRSRVLRDGRLLVDAEPSLRLRFEVGTRNEAFDLEPILREYRAPRERTT